MIGIDDGVTSGHLTLADILFLAAFIIFLVGGFMAFGAKAMWATLVAVGLACTALAFFLL